MCLDPVCLGILVIVPCATVVIILDSNDSLSNVTLHLPIYSSINNGIAVTGSRSRKEIHHHHPRDGFLCLAKHFATVKLSDFLLCQAAKR